MCTEWDRWGFPAPHSWPGRMGQKERKKAWSKRVTASPSLLGGVLRWGGLSDGWEWDTTNKKRKQKGMFPWQHTLKIITQDGKSPSFSTPITTINDWIHYLNSLNNCKVL